MYTTMILGAIAGLSLFLYGMQLMGDGLQKVAGEGLKGIIRKLTKNRFMSVLVGMFVTTIIQSSSATTVMVVGFVNAGLIFSLHRLIESIPEQASLLDTLRDQLSLETQVH